jgi:hypothetical protein
MRHWHHSTAARAKISKARARRDMFQRPRSRTKEYSAWASMKQRCLNPRVRCFRWYGGLGVRVCKRWRDSYDAFLRDMGRAPAGMTLDRYPDPSGDYEPGNVRWATWEQQRMNRRRKAKAASAFKRPLNRVQPGASPRDPPRDGSRDKAGTP